MGLPDNFYTRHKKDTEFHKKNFLRSYASLVDLDKIKKDSRGYVETMSMLDNKLSGIDFESNILFICRDNINKEVFLNGFSRLPYLHSYFYGNIIKIFDIYWGNMKNDNPNITDEEVMYSEQCINHDVMCVYVDKEMYAVKTYGKVLNSTIISRNDRRNSRGEKLKNWLFFKGTYSDLENNEALSDILRMFKSEKDNGYIVVDLNTLGVSIVSNVIKSTNKTGSTKNSLSDIY